MPARRTSTELQPVSGAGKLLWRRLGAKTIELISQNVHVETVRDDIVEREVKQALRRALLKYKLHTDQDLFDKAYGYIRQYY
jgi:hypothetical protein